MTGVQTCALPILLILDEPTRGIDVGAKVEVHQLIDELAAQGMAIIMISSDLPEVLTMSDRILVMREGRQVAMIAHDDATQERVLAAAMGQARDVADDEAGIDTLAGTAASAAIDLLTSGDVDPAVLLGADDAEAGR